MSYSYYPPAFGQNHEVVFTLTITNNETFDLTGMYFSENLPLSLVIENSVCRIDGDSIDVLYRGPIPQQILPGYNTYRWTMDSPFDEEGVSNILHPGEHLELQYAVSEISGHTVPRGYVLPFHTACFYGDGSGFFSTADTLFIPVNIDDIPTLNEWGLIILSLLILSAGTVAVIVSRRRNAEILPASPNRSPDNSRSV